ncbi:MAG: glycoside hydrolase family 18 protein [Bacteroidia bacterium]|nr:MAG: glycoside hydrolase family 18 protein [Bacteroidia bacterium]
MKILSTSALAFSIVMMVLCGCANTAPGENYMVVGYVAGFRDFDFSKIDASKLTHINYAFANIIDGRVMFDSERIDNTEMNSADIVKLNDLKKINPDLKILVSVGGWGWSDNFSDVALTDSSRKRFALSAADFILRYGIDGIDIDWEYPNLPGAGNTFRPEDVNNFTLLLKCVREHIDSLALSEGRSGKYLLTIATGGDSAYVANTNLGELAMFTDFINIMSYDLHNGLTWQAGHHTNLHLSEYDEPWGDATERAVRMHLEEGVPAAKINLGIPFYGRLWRGVEPVNNGLYRDAATTGSSISYTDILDAAASGKFIRIYDSSAAAPFLWNEKDSLFISYDDKVSLMAKMKYVRDNKLGGVMFWEYSEDPEEKLLSVIVEGLGND